MKTINSKGEGALSNLITLIVLAGLFYAGYVFLRPMFSDSGKTNSQAASSTATPVPAAVNQGKAGSMAGAAVQAGEAAGDLYSSGR